MLDPTRLGDRGRNPPDPRPAVRLLRVSRCLVPTLCAVLQAAPLAGQRVVAAGGPLGDWAAAAQSWLERQITPNRVVPDPDASRRGLAVSYDISPKTLPSGFHRSATYDDALVALVFQLHGDWDRAAFTLHALARLVRSDGSLWFTYNTANNWPTENDHESALVRAGTVSWVGYALTFYVAHAPLRSGDPAGARERAFFVATARRLADYLVSLRVKAPHDPRDGLLRLGYGTLTLAFDSQTRTVVERYREGPAPGISTENNIAAWFFLRQLAAVTGDARWSEAAAAIARGLELSAWNDGLGQFIEGFDAGGVPDSARALDCASLGALFLLARGERAKAARALATAERYYASKSGGGTATGYRPYADRPIYQDSAVGKLFFPQDPHRQWRELPLVWSEGSLQVALAYLRLGHASRARQITLGMRPLLEENGGLRYASMDLPFEMTDAASVAGSAWLILVTRALVGDSLARQIWR